MKVSPVIIGILLSLLFILPLLQNLAEHNLEHFAGTSTSLPPISPDLLISASSAVATQKRHHDEACALQEKIQARAKSTANEGELPPIQFPCLPSQSFTLPPGADPSFQSRDTIRASIENLYTNSQQVSGGLDRAIADTQKTLDQLNAQLSAFDANAIQETPDALANSAIEGFENDGGCPAYNEQISGVAEIGACREKVSMMDSKIRSNTTMLTATASSIPQKVQNLRALLKKLDDVKNGGADTTPRE